MKFREWLDSLLEPVHLTDEEIARIKHHQHSDHAVDFMWQNHVNEQHDFLHHNDHMF